MRASMVVVWHTGQGGRTMIMVLRLVYKAGAECLSVTGRCRDGSRRWNQHAPPVPRKMVNIAHFSELLTGKLRQGPEAAVLVVGPVTDPLPTSASPSDDPCGPD